MIIVGRWKQLRKTEKTDDIEDSPFGLVQSIVESKAYFKSMGLDFGITYVDEYENPNRNPLP